MRADEARILAGEPVSTKSENSVDDVPQEFKDWIKDNKERIERAKSLPYFIRDNARVVNDILNQKNITSIAVDNALIEHLQNVQLAELSAIKISEVGNIVIKNNGHSSREAQIPPLHYGYAPKSVIAFFDNKNIPLESTKMFITTKGITHAIRESKTIKNISVSIDELCNFVKEYEDYAIFYDSQKEDLIFANNTAKFIVSPNHIIKKIKTPVFAFISATRIKGNWSDHFSSYIKIKDAKHR